jgi:hypothetical protein
MRAFLRTNNVVLAPDIADPPIETRDRMAVIPAQTRIAGPTGQRPPHSLNSVALERR